jgi:hypothetical protein
MSEQTHTLKYMHTILEKATISYNSELRSYSLPLDTKKKCWVITKNEAEEVLVLGPNSKVPSTVRLTRAAGTSSRLSLPPSALSRRFENKYDVADERQPRSTFLLSLVAAGAPSPARQSPFSLALNIATRPGGATRRIYGASEIGLTTDEEKVIGSRKGGGGGIRPAWNVFVF